MKIDPNKPLSFNLDSLNLTSFIVNTLLVCSIITLVFSVYTSITNLSKLNQQPETITATTLLNQKKIQEATTLLQEQTINFTFEQ
ncbi:hypothetical protein ACFL2V_21535 [Pseudomonadota bacterium]